jgi:HAD superfamily hydrolase (TIGR01549 family)
VPYATVLFDVGETLLRVPEPASMYRDLLAHCGRPLPMNRVESILAKVRETMDEQVPNWVGTDLTLDCDASSRRRALHVDTILSLAGVSDRVAARTAFFDLYVGTEFFTLYPDVPETLESLKSADYRLGIVSNWESRLLDLCMAHGIARYFDFAVVSEREGYVKPHPHMYRRALELAGTPVEHVAHVGDSLRDDVEGATAVGIRGILLDREGACERDYQPRISSLAELPQLLNADR